ILPAGCLISAGSTLFLLIVILPARRLILAGSTLFLMVVILPAGCLISAGICAAHSVVAGFKSGY
ncbi:hypothetical protein Tco_1339175, partial [Tanacetum coccineum]